MLETIGSEELLLIRCKECNYEFRAAQIPARCPNPECRRTAYGNPVGRPRKTESSLLDSTSQEQTP